jgi:DNA-binding HxlR family transcriptional regulator
MLRSAGDRIKKGPMAKTAAPPSVLEPQCPSRLVLDRIADKWTALVIQILAGGTMRYAELQRAIGGISQKMLTQTLRSLERDGLVQRTVHPVVPPKVEYSLTRLGRTLIEPLHALCRWSEKHLAELQANRALAKAKAGAPSLTPAHTDLLSGRTDLSGYSVRQSRSNHTKRSK